MLQAGAWDGVLEANQSVYDRINEPDRRRMMALSRLKSLSVLGLVVAVAVATYFLGRADEQAGVERAIVPTLYAADANTFIGLEAGTVLPQERQVVSRTGTVEDRDVYYPGTEALAPDEMRVIACGTGMPNARPKQAAACWLVELGNGDKFLFDIGTGSAERDFGPQDPL